MQAQAVMAARPGTFAAFQSRDFRFYFIGQLISVSGTWMQTLAEGYLVFQLTQSEVWLGVVACAAGLPILLLAPVAGVIVEHMPRRRLLLITQTIQMMLALILATLTFTGTVQVAHIVVLAFLLGTTNALDLPARQTFVIEVVGPNLLNSGIALNSVLNAASRVLGPMAAGLALVQFGPAWCFFLNGLSFVAVIFTLVMMRVGYPVANLRGIKPIQQLNEGLSFARRHSTIAPLLLLAAIGGIGIVPIIRVLPAFADVVLHSPDEGYAALSVGQGIGAVIAGILAGMLTQRFGYGRLVFISVFAGALGTVIMALQTTIPAAVAASVLAGAFPVLLFVCLNTSIQLEVPNEYRGRVLALYTLAFMGLAPFSALVLGFLANNFGTPAAIITFALASAGLSALVFARWPHVTRV